MQRPVLQLLFFFWRRGATRKPPLASPLLDSRPRSLPPFVWRLSFVKHVASTCPLPICSCSLIARPFSFLLAFLHFTLTYEIMGKSISASIFKIMCIFGILFPGSPSASRGRGPLTPHPHPRGNLSLQIQASPGSSSCTFWVLSSNSLPLALHSPFCIRCACKVYPSREDSGPMMTAICRLVLAHHASALLHVVFRADSSRMRGFS